MCQGWNSLLRLILGQNTSAGIESALNGPPHFANCPHSWYSPVLSPFSLFFFAHWPYLSWYSKCQTCKTLGFDAISYLTFSRSPSRENSQLECYPCPHISSVAILLESMFALLPRDNPWNFCPTRSTQVTMPTGHCPASNIGPNNRFKVVMVLKTKILWFPNPLATGSDIHGSWGTWLGWP